MRKSNWSDAAWLGALSRYWAIVRRTLLLMFCWTLDTSCLLLRPQYGSHKKKVLITKLDAIGDFVLWLDSAKEYRTLFPREEYELVLLGNAAWESLAKHLPFFDRIISLHRIRFVSSPIYRIKLQLKVRKEHFDIVISPTFSREVLFGDSIVRVSGANQRIGSAGDFSNIHPVTKWFSDRWYSQLIPAKTGSLMELERNAEFLKGLGHQKVRVAKPCLDTRAAMPVNISAGHYYLICPGASSEIRRWPWQSYAALVDRIYEKTGMVGVLSGSAEEAEVGALIEKSVKSPLLNFVGKTSVEELVALIQNAKFMVGNETAAIHIAVAVSTPSVCILGGGHYGRFAPYPSDLPGNGPLPVIVDSQMDCFGCNWQCARNGGGKLAAPCISEIKVADVWSALKTIIPTLNQ